MKVGFEFFSTSIYRPWTSDAYWWQLFGECREASGIGKEWMWMGEGNVPSLGGVQHYPVSMIMGRWGGWLLRYGWKKHQPDVVLSVHRLPHVYRYMPVCLWMRPEDIYHAKSMVVRQQYIRNLQRKLQPYPHVWIWPVNPSVEIDDRVQVFHPVAESVFHAYSWQEEQQVRQQYAFGHPYFFTAATPVFDAQRVRIWLKAFSVLKKRLQSSVKWIWVLHKSDFARAEHLLRGYLFRNDILLIDVENVQQLALLTAAAYAYIAIGQLRDQWHMVLASIYAEVPVLALDHPVYAQWCIEAGLWMRQEDVQIIAANWLRLYQDEYWRKQMVEACKRKRANHTRENLVAQINNLLHALAGQ
ncbi:MAG: hypothetical protein K6T34_03530 [Thermoflavifilum sp.]|nr:hypothetical protein [Thermoflavifilum sp.]